METALVGGQGRGCQLVADPRMGIALAVTEITRTRWQAPTDLSPWVRSGIARDRPNAASETGSPTDACDADRDVVPSPKRRPEFGPPSERRRALYSTAYTTSLYLSCLW